MSSEESAHALNTVRRFVAQVNKETSPGKQIRILTILMNYIADEAAAFMVGSAECIELRRTVMKKCGEFGTMNISPPELKRACYRALVALSVTGF